MERESELISLAKKPHHKTTNQQQQQKDRTFPKNLARV